MASIARALRPAASRFAGSCTGHASPLRVISPAARAFSSSSRVEVKKYTKQHEWVELSEDQKTGTIGISDYAAHALGDVVYVELPTTPLEVAAGDSIGAVESVKSASDINSPISGIIKEVNSLLEEKPGTINQAPEDDGAGGGWVAKIEVSEAGITDLEDLMDAAAYKEFSESE